MNAEKILGLLAIALSVVGGFVVIPYAGLALVVIGLALGVIIDREGNVAVRIVGSVKEPEFSRLIANVIHE